MAPKPSSSAVKVQVYQGATARGLWIFNTTTTTLAMLKESIKNGPQKFQGSPDTKEFRLTRDGECLEDDHVIGKSCNIYAKEKEGKSKETKSAPAAPLLKVKNPAKEKDANSPVSIALDRSHNKVIVELGSEEAATQFFNNMLEAHNMKAAVQSATELQLKQLATLTGTSVKDLANRLGMTIPEASAAAAAAKPDDESEDDPVVEPAKVKKTVKQSVPKPAPKPADDESEDDPVLEAKVKKSVKQAAPKPAPKPVASAAAAAAAAADEEEGEEDEDEGLVMLDEADEDPQEEEEESEPAVEDGEEEEDEDEEDPVVAAFAKAKAKAASRGIFVDADRFVPTSRDKPSKKK